MNTRQLVSAYRKLLKSGDAEKAEKLLEENGDNEFFVSVVRFGDALVAAIIRMAAGDQDA